MANIKDLGNGKILATENDKSVTFFVKQIVRVGKILLESEQQSFKVFYSLTNDKDAKVLEQTFVAASALEARLEAAKTLLNQ